MGCCVEGVLHWVGQPEPGQEPARFEARLYDRLFTTQTPGSKKKKDEDSQDPAAIVAEGEPVAVLLEVSALQIAEILPNPDYITLTYSMVAHA